MIQSNDICNLSKDGLANIVIRPEADPAEWGLEVGAWLHHTSNQYY